LTWTWVEPFAGAAACTLRILGGRDLLPPVAWMGGKRRYARSILDAMGVPSERPAHVLLADAGPWGWVWPLLLAQDGAAAVARVLRSWVGEHPRDLWQRLAAVAPLDDSHERAAQWLWLQARSASGVPIWWDGWRLAQENGRDAVIGRLGDARAARLDAEKAEKAEKAQARLSWLASDGRGDPRSPGQRADKGSWLASNGHGAPVKAGAKPLGSWRMGEEQKKAKRGTRTISEKGTAAGRTGGMVNPATIAARVEAIALAFEGVSWSVHHGGAAGLEASRSVNGPTFAYLDPPYLGATGYGWDMPREEVLALARGWADAGAVVAVSEAEPLDLPGWHRVDLTREGGKPEWLTLSQAPACLRTQGALFA
jgi:hypothetical protein